MNAFAVLAAWLDQFVDAWINLGLSAAVQALATGEMG